MTVCDKCGTTMVRVDRVHGVSSHKCPRCGRELFPKPTRCAIPIGVCETYEKVGVCEVLDCPDFVSPYGEWRGKCWID